MEQNTGKLLRSLPRTSASPDFNIALLERLAIQEAPRRNSGLVAACLAGLLITALAGGQYLQTRRAEARLEALKTEQQRIATELEQLKQLTAAYEPVLFVGGTEEIELYVDLRESERSRSNAGGIQPASTQIVTDF